MRILNQTGPLSLGRIVFAGACCLLSVLCFGSANGQNSLSVSLANPNNSTIDSDALLMPAWSGRASGGSLFGRAINGIAHQSSPVLTHGNFQYSAWYRNVGFNEHIVLARRDLNDLSSGWSSFDTGLELIHGDANDPESGTQTQPWDNHNVVNMGISGDGRLHLSYDHHGNELNYIQGNATATTWDRLGVFGTSNAGGVRNQVENSLNGGPAIILVTYPRFSTNPTTGDMVMTVRLGRSGAGNLYIANYNTASQTWTELREFITGDDGVIFDDGIANASNSRNPYLNNINYSADGDLHASFTWRETANGTANHDLNYIRSSDGGLTWLNDSGDLVADIGETVQILSPGIIIGSSTNFITPFVNPEGGVEIIIDDFSGDLSDWTSTVILDSDGSGTAASNVSAFAINGSEQLELVTTGFDGIEQYAFIRDGLSLGVGEEVLLDVSLPLAGNRNLGLYVGGTAPTTGVFGSDNRQDFISVYADADRIATRGFDGSAEYELVRELANGAPAMFIAQTAANTFETGFYTAEGLRTVIATRTPAFPNAATYVGIYADAREQGTLGSADNLRIHTMDPIASGNAPLGLIDRNQTLMNQQGQTVDSNGGVHVLMWSRADPATHDSGDRAFDTSEAAHAHYFKDPNTGEWTKNLIPIFDEEGIPFQVGSRPQIAADMDGNVYAAFASPGVAAVHSRNFYDPGTLVIAGATANSGYQDWTILYTDDSFFNRFFEGEPLIDQQRLLHDEVLSVYIQEGSNTTSLTTSDIHILDFNISSFLLGDVNRDGTVDFFDISPFISVLSAGSFQAEADINGDGMVDFFDISPFIGLLSQ